MNIRSIALRISGLLSDQFGLDLRKTLRSFRGMPRFVRDLYHFHAGYTGRLVLLPCLHDWYEEGGTARGEYFWQDLYVARKIYSANPIKHVDIGSRVDGFVAHVASFRQLEVFDIRPITANIPGVEFKQGNLMDLAPALIGYCDSISCLHALEHFGLGRYGDPINPDGHEAGLKNMAKMLLTGGTLYLSVPVGLGRVEFNGQRVLDPDDILVLAAENGLELKEFAYITLDDTLTESVEPRKVIRDLARQRYSLGIFSFHKL